MPTYSYQCRKCKVITQDIRLMRDRNKKNKCVCGGVRERVLGLDRPNVQPNEGYPIHSNAFGVHPSQNKEAYDYSVKIGVPTERDSLGRAIFKDRVHRKKFVQHFQRGGIPVVDMDGGYGDP